MLEKLGRHVGAVGISAKAPTVNDAPQPEVDAVATWRGALELGARGRTGCVAPILGAIRKPSVSQARLTRCLQRASAEKQLGGYCFALSAMWLHETALGRGDQMMDNIRRICERPRIPLLNKQQRLPLSQLVASLETLNRKQFHGMHALEGTALTRQKIIMAHATADDLAGLLLNNYPMYALWDVSSGEHTIAVHMQPDGCDIYDPNDGFGVMHFEAGECAEMAVYLRFALNYKDALLGQPISLTAFARQQDDSANKELSISFAGVHASNVESAPSGTAKSVADMSFLFGPAVLAHRVATLYNLRDPAPHLASAVCGCSRDPAYQDVVDALFAKYPDLAPG